MAEAKIGSLRVEWNARLRTCAGKCLNRRACASWDWVPTMIQLNPLLQREGTIAIRDTFLHELAHALAPTGKHCAIWQRMARALGVSDARGHSLAILQEQRRPRRTRKTVGVCERCDLAIVRRARLPRNRTHTHQRCGGRIVTVEKG